jgi:sugar transferase (PEP-CTERM system associated)
MAVLRQYLSVAALVHALIGVALFFVSFFAATGLQVHGRGLSDGVVVPALVFAAMTWISTLVLRLSKVQGSERFAPVAWRALGAATLGTVLTYFALYLVPSGKSYHPVLFEAGVIAFFILVVLQSPLVSRREALTKRVLVLGAGDEAVAVEEALKEFRHGNHVVIGFVPLDGRPTTAPAHRLVMAREPLHDLVRRLRVNEIVVAVKDHRGGALPMEDLLECRLAGIRVHAIENIYERLRGRVPIESVKASWLIYGDGFRQNWLRNFEKRSVDVVASLVLLTLAIPVLVVTAIAIFLESGRPILYKQDRVGRGGRSFVIWKLRSMRTDAEADGKARWAQAGDTRITRVGRFIRKTRIDELPQLLNVLRGDMSLIGPRPERQTFVDQLATEIPFYNARHSVKPGLTGWAQVRYYYGASSEDAKRKLEYDLYYVKNHTLLLDIIILVETIRVVLRGEGAR